MARRSRMAVLKRQREVRKAEKAARKRAKRHGGETGGFAEPQPTFRISELGGGADSPDDSEATDSRHVDQATTKEERSS